MSSSPLFPSIEPYDQGRLKVSNLHELYYEQCGNPQGIPVVFVHGGPGGGVTPEYRRFFDPEAYRIVLFDQRGCGRSTPFAELRENTTWDLVEDLEVLRAHLGIPQWLVFGGSWGSTLALAYAETHPERVTGLILRGIFMCRPAELQWFYQSGADWIFPDLWEAYLAPIPEDERNDLISAYYKRLTSSDEVVRLEAARAWSIWEASTSKLRVDPVLVSHFGDATFALAFARIECHYFMHNAFLEPDQLLKNVYRIRHIPGVIIQGRYDIVCPARSAWDLHRAWPEAELHLVGDAGHSVMEPGIAELAVRATSAFIPRLRQR